MKADRLRFHERLGGGSYGVVFRVVMDGHLVLACKIFHQDDDDTSVDALRELQLLRACKHPNVIQYVDLFQDGDRIGALMPCYAGDLHGYILAHHPLPEHARTDLFRGLVDGVGYLHGKGLSLIHI